MLQNGKAASSCYHEKSMICYCVVVLRSVRILMQPVNIERTLGNANIRPTPSTAGIKNEWNYTSIPLICFQEFHTFNLLRKLSVRNATPKCHLPSNPRHSALFIPSAENYTPQYVRWKIQFSSTRHIDTIRGVLKLSHTIKYMNFI
jgi:hypothetical protein